MVKKLLYKWLFKKREDELLQIQRNTIKNYDAIIRNLREESDKKIDLEEWVDIDFSNIDSKGKPPHYLKDMTPEERMQFISQLNFIYESKQFQEVYKYIINALANQSFFKASEENMKNYRYGVLAVKEFMKLFKKAHNEFSTKSKKDEFDPLQAIPD